MTKAVLPRLDPRASVEAQVAAYVDALNQVGFSGEILSDYATRLSAASDNSIYQLPAAMIFPRTRQDVGHALRLLDDPRFCRAEICGAS